MRLSEDAIVRIAEAIGHIIDRYKGKEGFNANILDRIHASENDHSRILMMLLAYKQNGRSIFLESFLDNAGIVIDDADDSVIAFNRDNIDVSITSGNTAVIIENKIEWAVDQPQQIERYVDAMIGRGYDLNNIFVIYLTDDGRKKVSSDSLSEECRKKLGVRFLELDYRHFVLPWLKNEVFPMIPNRDLLLSAAVYQYIDYLEGRYGIRERDYRMEREKMDKIKDFLINELKLNENDNIGFVKGIDDFLNGLDSEITRIRNEHDLLWLLMSDIYPQMKESCEQGIIQPCFWKKVRIYQKNVFVLELENTASDSPINETNMFLDTYAVCKDEKYYLCFDIGKRGDVPECYFSKATLDYVFALDCPWSYDKDNLRIRKEIPWDKRYSRLPGRNDEEGRNKLISEIFEEIRKGIFDELGLSFISD